jgi:predicted permease
MEHHLAQEYDDNLESGMSSEAARHRANLDFGSRRRVREDLWSLNSIASLERLARDLRYALRTLLRSPGYTLMAVLTLGLGIGANSAVFSAIDAILLRPLSFPHADELVEVHQFDVTNKNPMSFVAPTRLEDWNRLNSTFQAISGYFTGDATLNSGDLPEKVSMAFVAPRFLQVWGVSPALGRDFTKEEMTFGGPDAVLVSNRFWVTRLHADAQAVGAPLRLGNTSYTVVGVLPASFFFPDRDIDLWTPNAVDAPYSQSRDSTWFTVLGRLKPGVSATEAQADLVTVQAQLGKQFPKSDGDLTVRMQPLKTVVIGDIKGSLWLLYGSVSLLLLIACTNIAALLMARTMEREQEIAIRYSLGAPRAAIIGQLLTEVFVLALAGSLLGLLVAAGAPHVFGLFAKELPRLDEITLNWRIVAYSLGCALAATLLSGLFPAIRGTRRNLSGTLSKGSRTQVSTRNPWQWILVGVQVSLAVAMLIGSGLLLRSFETLGRVNPGFDPEHVLALQVSGSWGETADMGKLTQRINRTLDGLRSVPGVEAAATSSTIPGNSYDYPAEFKVEEGTKDPDQKIVADAHFVSAGYFATMHIPLLQGEACRYGLPFNTAVVNRSFANRYFTGDPSIGHHLQFAATSILKPGEIRGIVGDAREQGVDKSPEPTVYWCSSAPGPDPHYLIRTHGNPAAMADVLRRKIHEIEPGRSVFNVMALDDHLGDRLAENRLRTILLTLFAGTAISLAGIGLYGTISYLGRTRRREVGLRLALGALPRQIAGRFVLQGMRVTLAGCVVGLLLGAGLSRLLARMLFGVSQFDPFTYGCVFTVTLLIAGAASLLPAVRAARVSPTQVLREE